MHCRGIRALPQVGRESVSADHLFDPRAELRRRGLFLFMSRFASRCPSGYKLTSRLLCVYDVPYLADRRSGLGVYVGGAVDLRAYHCASPHSSCDPRWRINSARLDELRLMQRNYRRHLVNDPTGNWRLLKQPMDIFMVRFALNGVRFFDVTWPSYHCCALICCKPRHWSWPSNGSTKESYTQGISVHRKVCLPRRKCLPSRLKTACKRCHIANWRDWGGDCDVRESR